MKSSKFVLYSLLAAGLAGCAGASVQNQQAFAPNNLTPPSQIVVYPFATDPGEIDLNSSIVQKVYRNVSSANVSAEQTEIARNSAANICLQVVTGLNQLGYNAVCQKRGVPIASDNVLIIDGQFTDISEGNRLRRTVIGFGAGESVVNADVEMFHRTEMGAHELLSFATHADSGKMPGVLVTGAPGAAVGGAALIASAGVNVAASGVKAERSSLGSLEKMTSQQVVDAVTQYCKEQGWGAAAPSSGTNL